MRKYLFFFWAFLVLLLPAGRTMADENSLAETPAVATTPKENSAEKPLVPATAKPAATTAVRKLPAVYSPGKPFIVTIRVCPTTSASAVIVQETVPTGWKITKAEPVWNKDAENTYKWLQWGGNLSEFTIKYQAEIPVDAKGNQKFTGISKTLNEKELLISGDEISIRAEKPASRKKSTKKTDA